ncbi:MAG: methylenetetrahydrofolate--tRNA-(uracil(54)-C(5))-methyltransferase (FADH(2)-oxidizing) TrmFO [Christensenellaceae bacterium]|jgi:methylenetetrahydrofolate--tRNA-(uracil-5-)-methyltransferase|nr:methylenetetrahydrofolate--tRNA-(uracil(54)-C(5))-methyltransferase (FADH(2)-oxidizing) TrmFO [Christensenellaceae bacterium]
MKVKVVGGGLAGCEAAYHLLKAGMAVDMYEMRPYKNTPAHSTAGLAELVCSNSLKSTTEDSAQGVLKFEMRTLDSLVLKVAEETSVPAGAALAVDRALFSSAIETKLNTFSKFSLHRSEVDTIEPYSIIATGPLTSDAMTSSILKFTGTGNLSFYDAAAPIIEFASVDMTKAFYGARYNKGDADYLNCPMSKEEYDLFYNALINAERVKLKDFEKGDLFEGCMPIEIMASRGYDAMRFGPLRPVGLSNSLDKRPFAVVQLRKEDKAGNLYNIVGFQTNLTFPAQRSVFAHIPALANAEYARYGVMHRNTYLNAPNVLNYGIQAKTNPHVFFAGQITGVEGYMESALSGILSAINMIRLLKGHELVTPPIDTLSGALCEYLSNPTTNFQPMRVSFGLLPEIEVKHKAARKLAYATRARESILKFASSIAGI